MPGRQNTLLLQPLLSDTEYKVTITPVYSDGEGVSVSAPGKTCEYYTNFLLVFGWDMHEERLTLLAFFLDCSSIFQYKRGLILHITQALY